MITSARFHKTHCEAEYDFSSRTQKCLKIRCTLNTAHLSPSPLTSLQYKKSVLKWAD